MAALVPIVVMATWGVVAASGPAVPIPAPAPDSAVAGALGTIYPKLRAPRRDSGAEKPRTTRIPAKSSPRNGPAGKISKNKKVFWRSARRRHVTKRPVAGRPMAISAGGKGAGVG